MRSLISVSALWLAFSVLFAASAPLDSSSAVVFRASDPAYTVPESILDAAIVCPNGLSGAERGIVLLVHGTGSQGNESWQHGPYVQLLPAAANIDACYINIANRTLGDAQISAEFVAYAVKKLASHSKTNKITVIGHSQGSGLNIPWTLLYFPQARALVSRFIGLAPDFRGTSTAAPLACAAFELTSGGKCYPVIPLPQCSEQAWQRRFCPNPLALYSDGRCDHVRGFCRGSDVDSPEPYTSTLGGSALNVAVQSVCGIAHVADHFTMLIDSAAYNLALQFIITGKTDGLVKNFNKINCLTIQAGMPQSNFNDVVSVAGTAVAGVLGAAALYGSEPSLRTSSEPKLMPCAYLPFV